MLLWLCGVSVLPQAVAQDLDGDQETIEENSQEKLLQQFNERTDAITNQASLGKELAELPGPNINFQQFQRIVIDVSAGLAASVGLVLLIWNAFKAISGREDDRAEYKVTLIKVVVGLTLVFGAYLIVATIMGIIWAT